MDVKQTVPQNVVLVCHKVYHAHMAADALIFAKSRIKESLSERVNGSDDEEIKIKREIIV